MMEDWILCEELGNGGRALPALGPRPTNQAGRAKRWQDRQAAISSEMTRKRRRGVCGPTASPFLNQLCGVWTDEDGE